MNDKIEIIPPANSRQRGSWGKRLIVGSLAIVTLAGAGVVGASAHDPERGQRGEGRHMEMREKGGERRGGMGMNPRQIGRMLDRVDATQEQKQQIREIFREARSEVRPLRREMRDTREELADLLSAPQIDRAAIEKLRADRAGDMEEASRKLTEALIAAAEVLTPEQRAELVEQFEGGRGWRR